MSDKTLTALMPHRNHGSFFVEDCPHCAAGKRIAELQTQAADYEYNAAQIITARDKRIAELEARLDALELKTAMPWEEDWERGYAQGWNECRRAALEQKD